MPLQKLTFRPGINREGTNYANEGGFYDCDKIRFRSGFPEKLGGWTQLTPATYLGVARSMWNWVDLNSNNYLGVGTNLKYYIEWGGAYYDVTPIRKTVNPMANNPFATAYSTLSATLSATATTLTLTSASSFPTTGGFILIGSEQIYYAGVSGSTLTGLKRGVNSTTAVSHASSSPVGCSTIQVTNVANGVVQNDFVTFSGATAFGGFTTGNINTEQQVLNVIDVDHFTINISSVFSTSATSGGGSAVIAAYQINTGLDVYIVGNGWGAGYWGRGGWGSPATIGIGSQLRLWSDDNFGQDLIIAPRGGAIYYWAAGSGGTSALNTRAVSLQSLANTTTMYTTTATFTSGVTTITLTNVTNLVDGCYITGTGIPANTYVTSAYVQGSTTVPISSTTTAISSGNYNVSYAGQYVPNITNQVISSAIQRFVIAFGANPYTPATPNSTFNPMLVRWSDQSNPEQWVPQLTNQSGEFTLTNGSYIMQAQATRQEILIWTDSCLYSMQYQGAPYVWGFQILMDNITVISPNSMITINNVTYWMGQEKFYMYSGRVETLPCSLRQYIFDDINQDQAYQIFAGANEGYNEVWWFYCSTNSNVVDKYVIYNYLDRVWYYGTMGRTAWLDTGNRQYPLAADYNKRVLYHESSVDDVATSVAMPINAYVQSSDFDIGDGHNFGFVWRILPDVNFNGSNVNDPVVTMTIKPRQNSGTPYGAADNPAVQSYDNYSTRGSYDIQQFDGQVYTRLRGRQMSFRIESNTLGVAWQLGTPRIDIRNDGRR
jgi:hypothetical protein